MRSVYDYDDACKEMSDREVVELATRMVNQDDAFGETVLSVMARTDRLQLCKKLLDMGLSPDRPEDSMIRCIEENRVCACEMLALLLPYSEFPLRDQHDCGSTLLHVAVCCGRVDVAKWLIDRGASMTDMDIDCDKVVDMPMSDNVREELLEYERCFPSMGNETSHFTHD